MTDPSCDVANLLTPDRFWKSVDKRGRNFAGLAGVCRARPGRGRPIVCPVERTQRGIIPRRVTYTAAKPNRAGWIAYEYLAGDSRDDPWTRSCSTILNLAGKIRFLDRGWANDGNFPFKTNLCLDSSSFTDSFLPRIAWTWPTRRDLSCRDGGDFGDDLRSTAMKMRSIRASACAAAVKNSKIREVGNKSLAGDLSFRVNLATF